MSSLEKINLVKEAFIKRKAELVDSEFTRNYSEKQYIEQVLNIIKSFESILYEEGYLITTENLISDTIEISEEKYTKYEIDNAIFICAPKINKYDISELVHRIEELKENKSLNKDILILPFEITILKAKLKI